MKAFRFLFAAVAASALLAGCKPFEDTSWVENSHVKLDWRYADPETGMRPVDIDSLYVRYYSTSDETPDAQFPMPRNDGSFVVPTDYYDVLVTHPSPYFKRMERFKSATIKLPTRINHKAEVVITENPEDMIYTGVMPTVYVNADQQHSIFVSMQRILKKINFVVLITDVDELLYPCTVDIAGMASEMKLSSGECRGESEAVQIFRLFKRGRFLNTEKCLTAYTGSVLSLGTVGRNVLYFTYTDAAGAERTGKYDLTSYLANWDTQEVTIRISIDATSDEVSLDGWDEGNTTDYIFDMEDYI